jgi:hypothetical protein
MCEDSWWDQKAALDADDEDDKTFYWDKRPPLAAFLRCDPPLPANFISESIQVWVRVVSLDKKGGDPELTVVGGEWKELAAPGVEEESWLLIPIENVKCSWNATIEYLDGIHLCDFLYQFGAKRSDTRQNFCKRSWSASALQLFYILTGSKKSRVVFSDTRRRDRFFYDCQITSYGSQDSKVLEA